jgi:hypothetical protein
MLTAFCESCAIAQEDYEIINRAPQSVVPVIMVAPAMVQMTQPQVTDYLQLWPHSWVHFGTMDEQCRTMGEWSESLMIVLRCREEFKWRQVAKIYARLRSRGGLIRACGRAHTPSCVSQWWGVFSYPRGSSTYLLLLLPQMVQAQPMGY